MRSVAVLGREFWFPLDKESLESPALNRSNNKAHFNYLRYVSTNSTLVTAVLQILVKERQTAHQ